MIELLTANTPNGKKISIMLEEINFQYKVTKVNLKIAYPDLNIDNIEQLTKLSIRESLISVYETFYTWGRNHITMY